MSIWLVSKPVFELPTIFKLPNTFKILAVLPLPTVSCAGVASEPIMDKLPDKLVFALSALVPPVITMLL
jgi:hypothetical protein